MRIHCWDNQGAQRGDFTGSEQGKKCTMCHSFNRDKTSRQNQGCHYWISAKKWITNEINVYKIGVIVQCAV